MKAAIYARVSTEGQEDNSSLPTQVEACRKAAEARGYEVPPSYTFEETYSGAELWNRPALSQLREQLVRARRISALFVYSTDRLARDPTHLLILLEEAESRDVEVVFVTDPYDGSEEGRLIQYVRGYAAKLERERIRERSMRGKLAKVRSGKLLGCGRTLYGYSKEPGARAIQEPEASTVRRIFEWVSQGVAIREIVRRLTEAGTPSPEGNPYWSRSTVSRILHEPAYAGQAYGWRWRSENGRLVERPRDEWIALPQACSPAIIAEEEWSRAQTQLVRNKQLARRNTKEPEACLLRGYVRCGNCRLPMWSESEKRVRGDRHSIYRCRGTVAHRDSSCTRGSRPWIGAESLDSWVWERLRETIADPELVRREVEKLRRRQKAPAQTSGLDKALARCQRHQSGILAAIGELGGGATREDKATRQALLSELGRAQEEETRLLEERRAAQEAVRAQEDAATRLDGVLDYCAQVRSRLGTFSYKERRLALEATGAEVFVYPNDHAPRAELVLHLPDRAEVVLCPQPPAHRPSRRRQEHVGSLHAGTPASVVLR